MSTCSRCQVRERNGFGVLGGAGGANNDYVKDWTQTL